MAKCELLPDIYSVGVIDWSIRKFHGYDTTEGTSYNSYLIMDEKPTIIDTVKAKFFEEMILRVSARISLDQVKYIVINHAEPDHSSALPFIIDYFSDVTIVCNEKCKDMVVKLYPILAEYKFQIIDGRSTLNIGKRNLKFIQEPMLHWPESMWTYSEYDKILFSNDAFGQHIACTEKFADEIPIERTLYLAKEYLANILGPFSGPVQKAVYSLSGINFNTVLTAHGLSWRGETIKKIIEIYSDFCEGQIAENKILILYDTVYGESYKAARTFIDGCLESNFEGYIINAENASYSQLGMESMEAKGFCVCCPTINNHCTPKLSACLDYLKGLGTLKSKPSICICAGGWNFKALEEINQKLEMCKSDVYNKEGIEFKFYVDETTEDQILQAATDMIKRISEK